MRGPLPCLNFKRRNATRNGYTNVDERDSDVSMAGACDFSERSSITHLLDARLQISPVSTNNITDNICKRFIIIIASPGQLEPSTSYSTRRCLAHLA